MDSKERRMLHGTYKRDQNWIDHLRDRLEYLIRQELEPSPDGSLPPYKRQLLRFPDEVVRYFILIAAKKDLSNSPLTLEQMVHTVLVDFFLMNDDRHGRPPDTEEATSERAELFATMPSEFKAIEGYRDLLILNTARDLTPEYLTLVVLPYINALSTIQGVVEELREYPQLSPYPVIRLIKQQSEIKIGFEGVAEAVNALKEDIIPWRRKNAQKIAELKAQETEADIEKKKAEAARIRASTTRERAEAKRLRAEAEKTLSDVEMKKVELQKAQLELASSKVQVAIDIISRLKSNLPDEEKLAYAFKIINSIRTLGTSELEPLTEPLELADGNGEDDELHG